MSIPVHVCVSAAGVNKRRLISPVRNSTGRTSVHETNGAYPRQPAHDTRPEQYCCVQAIILCSTLGGDNKREWERILTSKFQDFPLVTSEKTSGSRQQLRVLRPTPSRVPSRRSGWHDVVLLIMTAAFGKVMWTVKRMGWDECDKKWQTSVGLLTYQKELHWWPFNRNVTFRYKFTYSVVYRPPCNNIKI